MSSREIVPLEDINISAWNKLTPWYNPPEWGHALYHFASEVPPDQNILEIGSGYGKSTIMLALGHGRGPGKVITYDPHGGSSKTCRHFYDNLRRFQVPLQKIHHVCLPFQMGLTCLTRQVGLVFVDGDHQEESVYYDVLWALRLLPRGGVILVDDAESPSVARGIARAATAGGGPVEFLRSVDFSPGRLLPMRKI